MTPEMLVSIGQTIEQGHRLLHSLYDSGDLSIDQYDGIAKALLAASELRKSIETDGDLLIEKAERIAELEEQERKSDYVVKELSAIAINRILPAMDTPPSIQAAIKLTVRQIQAIHDAAEALAPDATPELYNAIESLCGAISDIGNE